MINGKMWLVVKPTVGIPLIIGGVALASLAIHTAVLTNTTWYPGFLNGGGFRMRPAAELTPMTPAPAALASVQLAPQVALAAK